MSERKSAFGCLVWGCAICVGLMIVGIGACVMMVHYGKKSVVPAADQYLDAVEGGEFARAWELVGDEWRERQSLEEFTAFEKRIRDQLGPCPSRRTAGIEMSATGEGSLADITYVAQCENGTTQITVTLRRSGRAWNVDGVRYDAPTLREVGVCPNCGAEHVAGSRFCSQCGHALAPEEPAEAGTAP
jgi:hypothetical protein